MSDTMYSREMLLSPSICSSCLIIFTASSTFFSLLPTMITSAHCETLGSFVTNAGVTTRENDQLTLQLVLMKGSNRVLPNCLESHSLCGVEHTSGNP